MNEHRMLVFRNSGVMPAETAGLHMLKLRMQADCSEQEQMPAPNQISNAVCQSPGTVKRPQTASASRYIAVQHLCAC